MKCHLKLLGSEGKAVARNFLVRSLESGVKLSPSRATCGPRVAWGFGIYAHSRLKPLSGVGTGTLNGHLRLVLSGLVIPASLLLQLRYACDLSVS